MGDLPDLLEALADAGSARRSSSHTSSLRGIRGVPPGDIARVTSELWAADPTQLPRDGHDLSAAFGGAWEDGLVATGLLATAVADDPGYALELGLDWAERTDDVQTADAIGWLVLSPATLLGAPVDQVYSHLQHHRRPETRRAAVAMGLGYTPTPVEGPAAAALREKLKMRQVAMVEEAHRNRLHDLCIRFVRDGAPAVQKGLRRLLRCWTKADPHGVVAWGEEAGGALSKLHRAEVKRAKRVLS